MTETKQEKQRRLWRQNSKKYRQTANGKSKTAKSKKAWESENKACIKGYNLRASLKFNYGLSLEEYKAMVKSQNNRCAICDGKEKRKSPNGKIKRLSVDHDHSTGRVRGLLCSDCNALLGLANDSTSVLLNAVDYLKGGVI